MGMKKNVRWIVDVAMTVLLLVLMARQLIGDRAVSYTHLTLPTKLEV